MNSAMRLALPVVLALGLSACTLGPDYQRPEIDVPAEPRVALESGQGAALADIAWFDLFDDPQLDALIATALDENLELRRALARVLESGERARLAGAGPFPSVFGALNSSPSPGAGSNDTSYSLGLVFGWELDLFGKLRRSSEAARAELLASEEGARAVMVGLVASVSASYFQIRELDRRIAIVERTISSQEDSLALVQSLKSSGVVSAAEEQQAMALLASSRAQLPALRRNRLLAENGLAQLLGRPPQALIAVRSESALPKLPDFIIDLPVVLLEDRPDLRAAEQRLRAATARVGVAIANRFPFTTIGLSAFGGRFSSSLDDLVGDADDIFSWGPTLSIPLIDFGRTRAAVGIADAQLIQATEAYRSAVLTALRELADAAAGLAAAEAIILHNQERVRASAEALRLQRNRFRQGVVAYLEVLDAERQLLAADLELAQAEFGRVQRFVELYRAFGGGADEARLAETLERLKNGASEMEVSEPAGETAPPPSF
jgi:multidrug efflux system outer membrane protein